MKKRERKTIKQEIYERRDRGERDEEKGGKDKKAIERSTVPFSMALLALHFSFVLWERD